MTTYHPHRRDTSRGMTLVELLLVLVLLVVVTSLALPLLQSSFSSVRLNSAADQVLANINETRTKAIETGHAYEFRFEPNGMKYCVSRYSLNASNDLARDTSTADWSLESTLPDQISFWKGAISDKSVNGQKQVTSLMIGDTTEWSSSIFFFPDGSTSNASLLLKNENELYQRITLRGLTGMARKSDFLSELEVERVQTRN